MLNETITLMNTKTRMFTLSTDKHYLTGCSSMSGNVPSRTNVPYTMNFNNVGVHQGAYQLNLHQAEEIIKALIEMRTANTAKDIIVCLDGTQLNDNNVKATIINNLTISEYRTESSFTVRQLSAQNIDTVHKELAAQTKLQQGVQLLVKNIASLTLKECEHVQTLLDAVA